jgi:hypothetical protein
MISYQANLGELPMPMPQGELDLQERGDDFALIRTDSEGHRSEMLLAELDVISLAQSAQLMMDRIVARRSRPGADARPMTPIVQIVLNTDLHKTAIHLLMIASNGMKVGFELPPEVARPLAERLPVRLAEIEQSRPTKQ